MASKCSRMFKGSPSIISSLKSSFKIKPTSSPSPSINRSSLPNSTKPSVSRFTFSRVPSELGGVQSMLPLHSTVATARMTSCLSLTSRRRCVALLQDEIDGT